MTPPSRQDGTARTAKEAAATDPSTPLTLSFLGHQSWSLRAGDVHVLVDPVLGDTMGHITRLPIHPPRDIDIDALLPIDLVVLSHAHDDHVDLPSLARLPTTIPILVAPLMPEVVVRAVQRLGFVVHRGEPGLPLTAGPLTLTLLPGAARFPVSEGRVAQVLVTAQSAESSVTALLGVDTPISSTTRALVTAGSLPAPDAVIVANNTQIPPIGIIGSGRNLLQEDPADGFVGLDLIRELCVDYVSGLPGPPAVILCGGGFLDAHELETPYAYDDHAQLAELARALSGGRGVFGPAPGEGLRLQRDATGTCTCTPVKEPATVLRREDLANRRAHPPKTGPLPLRSVLPDLPTPDDWQTSLARVDDALNALVPQLLAHPLGEAILGCHWWRGHWLGGRRLLLRLVGGPDGTEAWRALDLPSSRFVKLDAVERSSLFDHWPFGVEVFLQDLEGLIQGHLVVWDVLGVALRHWSPPGPEIPAFLCSTLAESVRVDRTAQRLARQLTALGTPTVAAQLLESPEDDAVKGEVVD